MKKKIILIIVIIAIAVLVILGIYRMAEMIAPGKDPYAERYELNVGDTSLILAILQFKEDNMQYKVPEQTELKDGPSEDKFLRFHSNIYFYFSDKDEILYTWVRRITKKKTTLAFVSVNKGLRLGNWKTINKDFDSDENDEQIKMFEERILNPVKKKLGLVD